MQFTNEKITSIVIEHTKEITTLKESAKSAHKRIDSNAKMIEGIHELAANVATMASEIKILTDRMDKSVERIESGLKTQGERIGGIEKVVNRIDRNEKELAKHELRLNAIEKEPAEKWKKITWLVIAGVVGAAVAFIMANIL